MDLTPASAQQRHDDRVRQRQTADAARLQAGEIADRLFEGGMFCCLQCDVQFAPCPDVSLPAFRNCLPQLPCRPCLSQCTHRMQGTLQVPPACSNGSRSACSRPHHLIPPWQLQVQTDAVPRQPACSVLGHPKQSSVSRPPLPGAVAALLQQAPGVPAEQNLLQRLWQPELHSQQPLHSQLLLLSRQMCQSQPLPLSQQPSRRARQRSSWHSSGHRMSRHRCPLHRWSS